VPIQFSPCWTDDRLVWIPLAASVEQFHEARLVRITNGGLAIWLHPFGMLEPEVVVNLLPKLGIGVDLVRHGHVKESGMPRECLSNASVEWSTSDGAANTRQQPSERVRKGGTQLAAVCATLGQLDHFVALALQQHGEQSALGKGRG
jgi:hypothetical protein